MALGGGLSRELKIFISGDASSLQTALGTAEAGTNRLQQAGSKLSGTGSALTKGVSLPLLAIGAAGIKSAVSVDEAFDIIRVGTGETGAGLKGLQESFKGIARETPAELNVLAQALSDVRINTGASGETLELLTRQIVEAGRITGEGVIPVQDITRVFGDWSVATSDQSRTLDKFFVASQKGGGSISSLAQKVVQFGAPLRTLGFNLDSSIALFTRFQKEGVNTETVLAGLRQFLARAAKAGKEAAPFFAETVREIQALTRAGKDAEALELGRERFGAKTFQDVTRAIQEGRFELDGFITDINSGKDSILAVSEETKDFGERWVEFKNKATIALAPLGDSLLPAIETALGKIIPVVDKVATAFNNLSDGSKNAILIIGGIAVVAGPLLKITGMVLSLAGAFTGVGAAAGTTGGILGASAAGPWGAVIAAGAALGVGLHLLIEKHFPEVNRALEAFGANVYDVLVDKVGPALEAFGGFLYDFFTNKGQGYSLQLNPIVGPKHGGSGAHGGGGGAGGGSAPPITGTIITSGPLIGGGGSGGSSEIRFAHGGIVDRPTFAMIGEDGAEAIVPLTKPHRAQEVLRQAGLIDERPASRDALMRSVPAFAEGSPEAIIPSRTPQDLLRAMAPASVEDLMHSVPAFAQGGIVGRGISLLRAQDGAHAGRSLAPSGTQPVAPSVVQPATRSASAPVYNISVTVNGSVTTERQLVDAIHEGLLRKQSRQDSLAFK